MSVDDNTCGGIGIWQASFYKRVHLCFCIVIRAGIGRSSLPCIQTGLEFYSYILQYCHSISRARKIPYDLHFHFCRRNVRFKHFLEFHRGTFHIERNHPVLGIDNGEILSKGNKLIVVAESIIHCQYESPICNIYRSMICMQQGKLQICCFRVRQHRPFNGSYRRARRRACRVPAEALPAPCRRWTRWRKGTPAGRPLERVRSERSRNEFLIVNVYIEHTYICNWYLSRGMG